MKKKNIFVLLIFSALIFHSCKTYDNITYVEGLPEGDIVNIAERIATTITTNDALIITVSATNPEAVVAYNPPVVNTLEQGETRISSNPLLQTYIVDNEGFINFPTLGRIKVAGKTRTELENYIKTEIEPLVTDPIVNVQIVTNNVTVMGEVTDPGAYPIAKEQITLFEALGMAKDLTIYGRRDNILIIRENGDNQFTSIRVDLSSPDLFSSPGFFIQKGDVVYVEPNDYRKSNSTYNSNKQFNVSLISTIISGISVITTLIIALLVK